MLFGRARRFGFWSPSTFKYHYRLLRAPPDALYPKHKTRLENTVPGFPGPKEADMLRRVDLVDFGAMQQHPDYRAGPRQASNGRLYATNTFTEQFTYTPSNHTLKVGVPVEYIVFSDEGHGFVKKENEIKGTVRCSRFWIGTWRAWRQARSSFVGSLKATTSQAQARTTTSPPDGQRFVMAQSIPKGRSAATPRRSRTSPTPPMSARVRFSTISRVTVGHISPIA